MLLNEIFSEFDNPLYRGYRDIDHAYSALKNNKLVGSSSQRFWDNGIRLKDNHADYRKSFWMKGLSTTRDIRFAMKWGEIIFVLDRTKLSQKYKIIPFNWGYSIPGETHHKKEREEFIVLKNDKDNYMDSIDSKEPDYKEFNNHRFMSPEGEIPNLNNYLLGIYLANTIYEWKTKINEIDFIKDHPKFKGFYDQISLKLSDKKEI